MSWVDIVKQSPTYQGQHWFSWNPRGRYKQSMPRGDEVISLLDDFLRSNQGTELQHRFYPGRHSVITAGDNSFSTFDPANSPPPHIASAG